MILNNLNDILITIAKSNFLCKEAFVGDVYDINANENKFGCFVATPMTAIRQNIGLITYTYTMYYIDRLTKKEDNLDLVQTDAVNFLKGLIDYVDDIPEIEVGDQTQFVLFRHNFDDWCAGAYIEVSFTVPEGSCGQNDFSVVEDLRTLNVDTNGTYTPSGFDGYNRVVVNVSGTGGDYYEKIDGLTIELDDDDCPVIKADYQLKIMTAESGDIKIGDQIDIDTEDSIVSVTGSLELNGNAVATQSWVQNQGYMKSQDEQIRIVSGEGDIIIGNQDMTSEGFQGISLNEGLLDLYAGTVNVKSDYFQFNGDDVATQEWVDAQGYLTEHQSLAGYVTSTSLANTLTDYATRDWVDEEVEQTLSDGGYATESWVENQDYVNTTYLGNYYVGKTMNQDNHTTSINGKEISISDNDGDRIYLTSDEFTMSKTGSDKTSVNITRNGITLYNSDNESVTLDYNKLKSLDGDFATQQWVQSQGYLTEHQDLSNYALKSEIPSLTGYATQQWVQNQGYLTEHQDLSNYALKSEIPSLTGYATQQWVQNQGYTSNTGTVTSVAVKMNGTTKGTITSSGTIDLGTVLTEHQDISGKMDKSSVWTGTESQWNALSDTQKASYTIALIKE